MLAPWSSLVFWRAGWPCVFGAGKLYWSASRTVACPSGREPTFLLAQGMASAPDCRWTLIREAGSQQRLKPGLAGWFN
jgi:hypothetical protein